MSGTSEIQIIRLKAIMMDFDNLERNKADYSGRVV
jgi:hypothetical protein